MQCPYGEQKPSVYKYIYTHTHTYKHICVYIYMVFSPSLLVCKCLLLALFLASDSISPFFHFSPPCFAAPFLSPWGVWLKLEHFHILPYNLMYWRDICRPIGIHLPQNVNLSDISVHTWLPLFLFFIETFF